MHLLRNDEKRQAEKKMKRSRMEMLLLLAILFAYGGFGFFGYWSETKESEASYAHLKAHTRFALPKAEETQTSLVDFEALSAVNADVVAWLFCEDTVLQYPVAQGEDNAYYLNHLFDGTKNANGCIFLDYRNQPDFSDENSILYGHNMKNGSMFASLLSYQEQFYYEAHPNLTLVTPEGTFLVHLFAGYLAQVEEDPWQIAFANAEEKTMWLKKAKDRSTFVCDVQPMATDRILTLSTCSTSSDETRYVLQGILEEKDEKTT